MSDQAREVLKKIEACDFPEEVNSYDDVREACIKLFDAALAQARREERETLNQLSDGLYRSVYPTKDGLWWHNGPQGKAIRRVRMVDGYPYDQDTHELLVGMNGEWASVLSPEQISQAIRQREGA